MPKKLNGYAKWILVLIAILTLLYNTIATHVIARNEIKHLQQDVAEIKASVSGIQKYLLERKF